ncbi:MAG: hypothetical protein IJY27_05310 [Clostridia bacterium]|nr:hypothetical protein [Clostridia bacterium]
MMRSKKTFASAEEARRFVEISEAEFEQRLMLAVERVCENKDLRLIGLTGPTCSGKTTTAKKLIKHLTERGKNVHVVSIDDFFYDRDVLIARADNDPNIEVDYDSEDTIDFDALRVCIDEVFSDEPTQIPKFDFIQGMRVGYVTIDPDDNDLFIFEGIQAIYPKVKALFGKYNHKILYICAESAVDVDGVVFAPNELRLMRRLVRDYKFRGAAPEFTLYLWDSVRANEELSIFPNAVNCDYFVNSTLPFEVNLLAPYLRDILPRVPADDPHKDAADMILKKLEGIEAVSPEYLIPDSLCYEFIERQK